MSAPNVRAEDFYVPPASVATRSKPFGTNAAADTSDDAARLAKAEATATAWEQMWRAHMAIAKAGGPLVAPIGLVLAFNRARDALQALGVDP